MERAVGGVPGDDRPSWLLSAAGDREIPYDQADTFHAVCLRTSVTLSPNSVLGGGQGGARRGVLSACGLRSTLPGTANS